jgi:hypothetical protein
MPSEGRRRKASRKLAFILHQLRHGARFDKTASPCDASVLAAVPGRPVAAPLFPAPCRRHYMRGASSSCGIGPLPRQVGSWHRPSRRTLAAARPALFVRALTRATGKAAGMDQRPSFQVISCAGVSARRERPYPASLAAPDGRRAHCTCECSPTRPRFQSNSYRWFRGYDTASCPDRSPSRRADC